MCLIAYKHTISSTAALPEDLRGIKKPKPLELVLI